MIGSEWRAGGLIYRRAIIACEEEEEEVMDGEKLRSWGCNRRLLGLRVLPANWWIVGEGWGK